MGYTMQVKVKVGNNQFEWKDVHPTNGDPYLYQTKQEAEEMLKQCYPDCDETQVRVKEQSK